MPKPKYWGVELNRNRHGRKRWYFRPPDRKGPRRIRLPDSYGSPEFDLAWRACMAGAPLPAPGLVRVPLHRSRGTLGWLIRLYLRRSARSSRRPGASGW
jgi:hypothetical protein